MTRYFPDNPPPSPHNPPQWGLFAGSTRAASGGLFSDIGREEALEIIQNSLNDEECIEAYGDKSHADHERVVMLMTAMHRIGYPEPAREAAPSASGDATASQIIEQATGQKATLSPLQARAEIANLQGGADKAFSEAYFKNDHPAHAFAVQRMADLHSTAYPEPSQGEQS